MAKTHPHTDSPTLDDLAAVVAGRPAPVRDAYLAAHRLVMAAVPDLLSSVDLVDATIGYGAHQHGYNGWGMAALSPHARWVNLTLLDGVALSDPDGLLEGTAARMRHVRLRSADQLAERAEPLTALLRAAADPHRGRGESVNPEA